MSFQTVCPGCDVKQTFADRLEGKTVKCEECGEKFVAEAISGDEKPKVKGKSDAVQARPPALPPGQRRSRRRDEDDDADDRPRRRSETESGGAMLLVLLGGGAALVLLLLMCGGAGIYFLRREAAPGKPAPAQEPIAEVKPQPGINPPPPQPQQQPPFDPGPKEFPKKKGPKKNPPIDPFPKDPPPPAPAVKWAVLPDPGPDVTKAPANVNALPLFGLPQFVYPSTPSPFVAIRHGQVGKEGWQILDLQTFKQVAGVNGKLDLKDAALSPDGKLLAGKGKLQLNSTAVHVFSLAEGRIIQTIQLDTQAASLRMIDFIENGHLITYKTRGLTGFYEIYNIGTGMEVKRFTVEGLLDRKNNLALSPGRKYLAVGHKNQIDIFHCVSGQRAGELRLPLGNGTFKALAFSPDGKELACLLEAFGSSSRLLTWKMADGAAGVEHKFVKDVHTLVKNAFGYRGAIMEWIPDNSGWLLYGQLLVDYQSGAPVHTIAYDAKEFRYWPRRLVGKNHVAWAGGTSKQLQLGIAALPMAEIAANIKAARAGGGPVAALPAAKPADLAAAKVIPAPNGDVSWAVQPDPAPASKGKLAAQPIPLRTKPPELLQIQFCSGASSQAVAINAMIPNPLAPRKVYRADRYSLADGKFLGSCDLFTTDRSANKLPRKGPSAFHADLSPDATRLIARQVQDSGRLDIWNLAEGKHLVGWQPHEGAAVESFAMLDADRAVTCGGGKLIHWKLPECQAVYVADGYRGPMQLSAGRKYIAIVANASLNIVEAATGERRGQLEQPGGVGSVFRAGAFSRDGKEYAAAVLAPASGARLARWSLDSGKIVGVCNGNFGDLPMAFMGKHVLHGNTLFDFNLKGPLWTYIIPGLGIPGIGSPDGRFWFAATVQNTTVLTAQALPDAGATALSAQVAKGNVQPVVTPGMPIQLQINAGSEKFRTQVQSSLQGQLQGQGFKIGPGGLTIAISAQESATGAVLDYELRAVGAGIKRQIIKISERQVACQYTITDARGTVIARNNAVFKTPGALTFQGNDYDRQLNEAMWNSATSWGASAQPPRDRYWIGGQLQTLPKIGPLTGGG